MERQDGFRVQKEPNEDPTSDIEKDQTARSNDVFKLIQSQKWSELLDFLNHFVDAASEWVTENNSDDTVRWRSLPIHLACEKQPPVDVLFNLVSLYPDGIGQKNYGGDLPIHIACREGASKEVINFMIVHDPFESTSQRDCEGRLPLHLAARDGTDIKVIEGLLEINAKAARETDDFGLLPLHWACSKNAPVEIVEKLIDAYPYGIETRDTWGRTPLVLMKMNKSKDKAKIVELLSRDVAFWTDSLLDTIATLSGKVIENGKNDKQRKILDVENQSLTSENFSLKKDISRLNKEISAAHDNFLYEMEQVQDNFHHENEQVQEFHAKRMETMQQKSDEEKGFLMKINKDSERKIADLRSLVDGVVQELKVHKAMVHEKEEGRKELKANAIALVKRVNQEKARVDRVEDENRTLKIKESQMKRQMDRKDEQLDNVERTMNVQCGMHQNSLSYEYGR